MVDRNIKKDLVTNYVTSFGAYGHALTKRKQRESKAHQISFKTFLSSPCQQQVSLFQITEREKERKKIEHF